MAKSNNSRKERITCILQCELGRLKSLSNFGHQLTVVWMPNGNSSLAGEVRNDVIFIYEAEKEKALSTLRHEFFDFLVSSAAQPCQQGVVYYQTMVNALLAKIGENAYLQKEKSVNALAKIIEEFDSNKRKRL